MNVSGGMALRMLVKGIGTACANCRCRSPSRSRTPARRTAGTATGAGRSRKRAARRRSTPRSAAASSPSWSTSPAGSRWRVVTWTTSCARWRGPGGLPWVVVVSNASQLTPERFLRLKRRGDAPVVSLHRLPRRPAQRVPPHPRSLRPHGRGGAAVRGARGPRRRLPQLLHHRVELPRRARHRSPRRPLGREHQLLGLHAAADGRPQRARQVQRLGLRSGAEGQDRGDRSPSSARAIRCTPPNGCCGSSIDS